MSSDRGKVIHGFGERLALDQEVRALGEAPNAFELDRRARALAAEKGDAALNALLRQLDTNNATLRGGLGLLAQYLEPSVIVPALQQAATDPKRSDDARFTAVMILERYLETPVSADVARALPEPEQVARQSALEALAMAESSPLILVEYAGQLLAEPPEVIDPVLEVIAGLDDPRRARLLMTIAAYAEPDIALRVLNGLGGVRHAAALESLHTLRHLAEPSQRALAERQIRKLQLAGVRVKAGGTRRALWSPINAQGQSMLWWIHGNPSEPVSLLTCVLHDALGVIHADARAGLAPEMVPEPAPPGAIHHLRIPGSHHTTDMIELEPDLGLALIEESVAHMRALEIPWPGEMVVFGHWLWSGESLQAYPALWPEPPDLLRDKQIDPNLFGDLFKHDAFTAWAWTVPDIEDLLDYEKGGPLRRGGPAHRTLAQRLVKSETGAQLGSRLHRQTIWLTLAGELEVAALAAAARQAVDAGQDDHPFIEALAWRSLLTAAADRVTRKSLRLLE